MGPWAARLGEDKGPPSPLGGVAHRCSPRQELQQKRAQKSGNADLGLLKGPGEPGKPQTTQEPTLRPGSAAQQTRKANNTGEQVREPGGCPATCPPLPPALCTGTPGMVTPGAAIPEGGHPMPRPPHPLPSGRPVAEKEVWPLPVSSGPLCHCPVCSFHPWRRGVVLSRRQALLLHLCPSYSGAGHRVPTEQLHQLPDLSPREVRALYCPRCSMRSTVARAVPGLHPPSLASSQGLPRVRCPQVG